jgi:hypothetical protein
VTDAELDTLIAEARAIARERARDVLADELTADMLERARTALRPAKPAAGERGWYVFGVVTDPPPELPGGMEVVAESGLAAVTRRVALDEYGEDALRENLNDIEWLEAAARRHEEVLDALLRATTVIPLRLCTVYRSEDAVRDMLARERAALHEALDRLRDHAEWGLKVFCDRAALARSATAPDDVAAQGEGAAYLARRRAEAYARERARELVDAVVSRAHERLAAVAQEALVNPLQGRELTGREDDMALNGVYLVDDDAVARFRAAAEEIADAAPEGLSFELTGPWPPYNFVKRSVEAAR